MMFHSYVRNNFGPQIDQQKSGFHPRKWGFLMLTKSWIQPTRPSEICVFRSVKNGLCHESSLWPLFSTLKVWDQSLRLSTLGGSSDQCQKQIRYTEIGSFTIPTLNSYHHYYNLCALYVYIYIYIYIIYTYASYNIYIYYIYIHHTLYVYHSNWLLFLASCFAPRGPNASPPRSRATRRWRTAPRRGCGPPQGPGAARPSPGGKPWETPGEAMKIWQKSEKIWENLRKIGEKWGNQWHQNGDFMGLSQTKVWLQRQKWRLILGYVWVWRRITNLDSTTKTRTHWDITDLKSSHIAERCNQPKQSILD